MLSALFTAAACAGALVNNPLPQQRGDAVVGRRALLASAGAALLATQPLVANAKLSELADPTLSKDEFYAKLAERKEAERVAALPINQLKRSRDQFNTASKLLESEEYNTLRDVISDTTGRGLTTVLKEGRFAGSKEREVVNALRKTVYDVDNYAYSKQEVPGANAFSGYCADGVVPRETGGCKLKPKADKAPLLAKLKEASTIYDKLVKLCETL